MVESRIKNQKMAKEAIFDYLTEYPDFGDNGLSTNEELMRFVKFFSTRMLKRVEDNDCYFVDMLEDLERME